MSIINDNIKAAINIIANGGWRGLQNGNGLNPAAKRIRNGDYVGMFNNEDRQAQLDKEARIRAAEDIRQKILLNNKLEWELNQKMAAAKKAEEAENMQMQLAPYMPTGTFDSETGNMKTEGYIPFSPESAAITAAAGPGYMGSLFSDAIAKGNQLANLQKQQPEEFQKYMAAVEPYKNRTDYTGTTLYSESGDAKPADDKATAGESAAAQNMASPADILSMSGAEADPYYNIVYKPNYIAEKEYQNKMAKDLFENKEGIKQDNKLDYAQIQHGFRLEEQDNKAENDQRTEKVKGEIKLGLENRKTVNSILKNLFIKKCLNNLVCKKDSSGKNYIRTNAGKVVADPVKKEIFNLWKQECEILLENQKDKVLTLDDQFRIGKEAAETVKNRKNGYDKVMLDQVMTKTEEYLGAIAGNSNAKSEYNTTLNSLLSSPQNMATSTADVGADTKKKISEEKKLTEEYGKQGVNND